MQPLLEVPRRPRGTNAVIGRSPAGQRIGPLEEARKVIGSDLKDTHSQSIGRIEDMVVDLESGRVLYSIATLKGQNEHIALPATILKEHHTGKGHVLNADINKLSGAPKFGPDRTNDPGNLAFVGEVYQFFGVPTWWEGSSGSFNNTHRLTTLLGKPVKDVSNADFGKVDDAILDVNAGRVPFLVLNRQNAYYAIPPNAFTLAPDKTTLVTGLDQNTLTSAPRYTKGNVQMLANVATATAIYRHYGKEPYFASGQALSPTSNTNASRLYPVPAK